MGEIELRPLDKTIRRLLVGRLLVPLLLVTLLTIGWSTFLLGKHRQEEQLVLARSLSRTVSAYLDQAERALNSVAVVAETSSPDAASASLAGTWEAYDAFDSLYLLDEAGIVTMVAPSLPHYEGLDLSRQPHVAVPGQPGQATFSPPFTSLQTGHPTVHVTRPLEDGRILVGELSLADLQETLADWASGEGGPIVFITDRSGTLLAHPSAELVDQQSNVGDLPVVRDGLGGKVTGLYFSRGLAYLSSAAPVDRTGWVVVVEERLLSVLSSYLAVMGLAFLLALIIWFALNWSLRRQLHQQVVVPVTHLCESANSLAAGNYTQSALLDSAPGEFVEIEALSAAFRRMAREVQSRERQVRHINEVLRAIRNVNQLIVREKDRTRLLQGVCDCLVETRGYLHAWAVVQYPDEGLDDGGAGRPELWAEAGVGERFDSLVERWQADDPLECIRRALEGEDVAVIDTASTACSSCPLSATYDDRQAMAVRLARDDRVYGVLAVSLPAGFDASEEECSLVHEVAEDIALALHGIHLEEERAQAEETQRALLSAITEIALLMQADGTILLANDAFCSYFGRSPAELIGTSGFDLYSPAVRKKRKAHFEKVLAGGVPVRFEEERDGRWFDNSFHPVLDEQGEAIRVAIHAREITEQKRITETLEQRVAERTEELRGRVAEVEELNLAMADVMKSLKAANEELEAFAYSVSHDLRAPLRAISGFGEILIRRHHQGLDEKGQHYLGNIVQASAQMGRLIDDLLSYSRLGRQAVAREQVPLSRVMADVVQNLAPRVAEVGADVSQPDDLPMVRGDPTLLGQIFGNLLENALTFRRPEVPPKITISWEEDDNYVVVGVTDNGIGIPAEFHEKIFNIFQRLHNTAEYPGTGIGLSIVQKAAEKIGGEVGVESIVGEGSTFWVRLQASCAYSEEEVK